MSGRVYREATFYAQRQDEFTKDAAFFGIDVPPTYGCISGCKFCLDFRNEVRTARERYDAQWLAFSEFSVPSCGGDDACDGTCRITLPVAAPTGEAIDERIAVALELIAARLA